MSPWVVHLEVVVAIVIASTVNQAPVTESVSTYLRLDDLPYELLGIAGNRCWVFDFRCEVAHPYKYVPVAWFYSVSLHPLT